MEMMEQALRQELEALRLTLSDAQIAQLCAFGGAVLEQNKVMNLTAVTDPAAFARLHLADSLTLLRAADPAGKTVLDVGTGAGFPGVPLKIACPSMQLTLLDSTAKKINWLAATLPALGIEATCISARAEELDGAYDLVVSRAVARLNLLAELCLPLTRVGGQFIALKGRDGEEEVSEAYEGIRVLGGELRAVEPLTLPGDEARLLVVIEKVNPTPPGYPRPWGRMKKNPL